MCLPCENIEFEVRNVIVARQIDGGLKRHRLQAGRDWVHFGQFLSENFPWNEGAEIEENQLSLICCMLKLGRRPKFNNNLIIKQSIMKIFYGVGESTTQISMISGRVSSHHQLRAQTLNYRWQCTATKKQRGHHLMPI